MRHRSGVEAGGSAPGRVRVLVADDNRDYADSLAEVLRQLGCDVWLCYDGRAALEAAQACAPDLCLFDIGMPGLDGHELAAAVRRLPGGPHMVLVAVTGWGEPQDAQRARAAGFDHHFVKPVDVNQIVALLARWRAAAERPEPPR